jgi:hypothetical protein
MVGAWSLSGAKQARFWELSGALWPLSESWFHRLGCLRGREKMADLLLYCHAYGVWIHARHAHSTHAVDRWPDGIVIQPACAVESNEASWLSGTVANWLGRNPSGLIHALLSIVRSDVSRATCKGFPVSALCEWFDFMYDVRDRRRAYTSTLTQAQTVSCGAGGAAYGHTSS